MSDKSEQIITELAEMLNIAFLDHSEFTDWYTTNILPNSVKSIRNLKSTDELVEKIKDYFKNK